MPTPTRRNHIVIVGAASAGLYAALQLQSNGFDADDFTVIDPRANVYTRPGAFNDGTFQRLLQRFNMTAPVSQHAHHIKELERHYHAQAISRGITILQQRFISFAENNHLIIENQDGTRETLPADLVLDATGAARAVIREANRLSSAPFTIQPVADNPLPRHLLAYVHMSDDHCNALDKANKMLDVEQVILLRKSFGWTHWEAPDFHLHRFDKQKVCLYSEVPATLAEDQKDAWLQALIAAFTRRADVTYTHLKPSRKYPDKPRFHLFTVNPQVVEPALFLGDDRLPAIIPIGDARLDCDYRDGISTESGCNLIDELVVCLSRLQYQRPSFEMSGYVVAAQGSLRRARETIFLRYIKRQWHGVEFYAMRYGAAFAKATSAEDQAVLQQQYEELQSLANIAPPQASLGIAGGFVIPTLNQLSSQPSYGKYPPPVEVDEAMVCYARGDEFHEQNKLVVAFSLYQRALDLLSEHPYHYRDEKAALYLALCRIATGQSHYRDAFLLSDSAFQMMNSRSGTCQAMMNELRWHKLQSYMHILLANQSGFQRLTIWSRKQMLADFPEHIKLIDGDGDRSADEKRVIHEKYARLQQVACEEEKGSSRSHIITHK